MLTQASTAWHQEYEGTVKTSLRATLWGVLLMEWQAARCSTTISLESASYSLC